MSRLITFSTIKKNLNIQSLSMIPFMDISISFAISVMVWNPAMSLG
eukprot:CAMPEP_0113654104 /NCGR_PEP_ID=MMETSP0017_2-20120614/28974_1 /TAXON_ID=2856 /ORGANISM="Cylindrotheca closterium" /LENGTH=45 /DNA_ID=CAMNT_0000567221 /DNA_START=77 /DNA_END=210 /DNA_ORIENTATION=- /assembly_acc=CAM_ASM_000147